MRELRVVEKIEDSALWLFNDLLYNQNDFQKINNDLPQLNYYLVELRTQSVVGHIAFQLEEGKAVSHIRAPFGGFAFLDSLTNEELTFFIVEVERRLKNNGQTTILINQGPLPFFRIGSLSETLGFLGFKPNEERKYQLLNVAHGFEEHLHDMELRKLKKSREKNFRFDLAPNSKLKEVLDFVIEQRDIKGYAFSMDWSQLREYQKTFPDHYLGARVWDDDRLIAATILVKESEKVLYQFAPAHLKTYNRYSPIVFMTEQICEYAKTQGYDWLNLGTSYLGDEQNESLFAFKEKLGAEPFIARSFQKVINS